jgi:hypothetical protein
LSQRKRGLKNINLYSTKTDKPSVIELKETQNIKDASKALKKMYDSLPDSSPLKLYIKNNCLHLLSLPDTTGIIAKDNLKVAGSNCYRINSTDKSRHPSKYDSR